VQHLSAKPSSSLLDCILSVAISIPYMFEVFLGRLPWPSLHQALDVLHFGRLLSSTGNWINACLHKSQVVLNFICSALIRTCYEHSIQEGKQAFIDSGLNIRSSKF
jgi:hypothetical protein